ncbi:MAG: hypothetical protein ACUVX8_11050 [Candidatus Zipacnadales bacterium]
MAELLVAMLVLLLGIWVVAAKFPKLAEVMRGEKTRDLMTHGAEQLVANAKDSPEWLPTMIAAYDPAGQPPYLIDESVLPVYDPALEPDWDNPGRPRNVVENLVNVIGETFRVPAPSPGATAAEAPYLLMLGPAETIYSVYQPIPLTRDDNLNPTLSVAPYPGMCYVTTTGEVRFRLPDMDPQGNPFTPALPSAGYGLLDVSYAWVDRAGNEHWRHGEIATCRPPSGNVDDVWVTDAPLEGVTVGGGSVVPDSLNATFRYQYDVVAWTGPGSVPIMNPPVAAFDSSYGHALWFAATEQGKTLCVDYRLFTVQVSGDPNEGRRIPFLCETHRVPDAPTDPLIGTIELNLNHRFIEEELPLFPTDTTGAALPAPYNGIHVFAVDTETGEIYTDADGTLTVDYTVEGDVVPGWEKGRLSFPPGSPVAGRELRFYYRNVDSETVQLQRAPASFVEDIWTAAGAPLPGWAIGRWFRPTSDGVTYDPLGATVLLPDSCVSQTVRIEYRGGSGRRVELHTLGAAPPAVFSVDDPDMSSGSPRAHIISVTGVSMRGFATWFDRARLRTASVETILMGQLEPTLAKDSQGTVFQP